MKNCEIKVSGNVMTITVDLSKRLGRSQGGLGKNMIVATTSGNQPVVDGNGNLVSVGLNVYTKE